MSSGAFDAGAVRALLGPLADPHAARDLAQSVVETASGIFQAKAASIMELIVESRELEFVAVVGEGAAALPGTRFDSTRGIAGWVLATRQTATVDDVRADPRFALDVAERSGYVPDGLMAVPLIDDEDRPLGVLQVLDRPQRPAFGLGEARLLELLGAQAVAAIQLRRAGQAIASALAAPAGEPSGDPVLAALARLDAAASELDDAGAKAQLAQAVDALAELAARLR